VNESSETGLESIQSYISPVELKALDDYANGKLRSRSDVIRLIIAEKFNLN